MTSLDVMPVERAVPVRVVIRVVNCLQPHSQVCALEIGIHHCLYSCKDDLLVCWSTRLMDLRAPQWSSDLTRRPGAVHLLPVRKVVQGSCSKIFGANQGLHAVSLSGNGLSYLQICLKFDALFPTFSDPS